MSTLQVKVRKIDKIKSHFNADKLEIAVVGGWQAVVPKREFQENQLIIYFPPDTIIPQRWAEYFGVTKYCQERSEGYRIRQCRLRGEPSFGLVVKSLESNWIEGQDVADYFQATKYEPPIIARCEEALPEHLLFPCYTDIENLRNYPTVFMEGESVWITEKIHGTNCRVGIIDGERMAGSRTTRRRQPEEGKISWYWFPWSLPNVEKFLEFMALSHKQVVLFGEVFGRVQGLKYGKPNTLDFAAFDLYVDGKYLNFKDSYNLFLSWGVPIVPMIQIIPFNLEELIKMADGQSLVPGANHIREGIVVRSLIERYSEELCGRLIGKIVSGNYLTGKWANEDTTDV